MSRQPRPPLPTRTADRRIVAGRIVIAVACAGGAVLAAVAVLRRAQELRTELPRYSVLGGIHRPTSVILYVRLYEKTTVPRLNALSLKIRTEHTHGKPRTLRTLIWFSLPGRRCPEDAWAFVDLDPDPEVQVRGFSIDEERELLAQPLPPHTELVGVWLDDREDGGRYAIYRVGSDYFLAKQRPGTRGDGVAQRLLEKPAFGKRRLFEQPVASTPGQRYLVREDGKFDIRDDDGVIVIGEPVAAPGN